MKANWTRENKAAVFALLWSIWGAAYNGPELAAAFITAIGVFWWIAAVIYGFLDRHK